MTEELIGSERPTVSGTVELLELLLLLFELFLLCFRLRLERLPLEEEDDELLLRLSDVEFGIGTDEFSLEEEEVVK